MIRLEGLSKRFGELWAVRDVDLHVRPGEVFGFLGPNGAGKTTTMKIMVGLISPTSGRVTVGGVDVLAEPIRAKQAIGYIPDRPYLYEKLSAEEFLFFVAGLYGGRRAERAARADELLELFGLRDWRAELIESFSHGMKQRLTMAAALLHRPQLLVVDEPMVGLDPRGAKLVKTLFRRMGAQAGGTVFLSTHTLEVAEELCDRVAILNEGRIVALGSMDEIRAQVGDQGAGRLQELFMRLTGGDEPDRGADEIEL
ncbi:MAG: ABC transporter ATP-binding protein [Deltaproteobacteria bacterium]|nr:ABC transporter ATP-binding protein [Deltaproteobacteria bacterium]